MKRRLGCWGLATFSLLALLALLTPAAAHAHVSVVSGPAFANTTQEVAFGVGHGCAGADTTRIEIDIPAGVTSVRPVPNDFGAVSVQKDDSGAITSVSWQKADADVLPADLAYYKLVLRMKVPNAPFTTLYFPTHQTCRAADQTSTTVDWVSLPAQQVADGGADEPAPALPLLPPRQPGWNKLTVPTALTELGTSFADAIIVWRGTAAYSANSVTQELITATSGVTPLTALSAGDVIWVRY